MRATIDYLILDRGDRVAYADGGIGFVIAIDLKILTTVRCRPGPHPSPHFDAMSSGAR